MSYQLDFPVYNFQDISTEISNGKDIRHIVFIKESDALQSKLIDLLNKILSATGNDLQDFAIISVKSQLDISSLYGAHDIKNILIFGINPIEIGLKVTPFLYEPLKIRDSKLIIAHSLEKLESYSEGKKLLWKAMKPIFINEE